MVSLFTDVGRRVNRNRLILMKVGFTALALFGAPFHKIIKKACEDRFDAVELLCEGPYLPRHALRNLSQFEIAFQYDIELTLHSPTVDLNPASVNIGIREETARQLKETVDLAAAIGASTITTHPGYVKRINDELTKRSKTLALQSLDKWADYATDVGLIPAIENMPRNPKYFCTDAAEHRFFVTSCGAFATIDIGHAHTNSSVKDFLHLDFPIAYFHVSDNDGERDLHLTIGEGTIDWSQLKGIRKAIIEVNDYAGVKQSRDRLTSDV